MAALWVADVQARLADLAGDIEGDPGDRARNGEPGDSESTNGARNGESGDSKPTNDATNDGEQSRLP